MVRRVGIIGAGRMGEALISGLLRSGAVTPDKIRASDVVEERRRHISRTYRIECHSDNKGVVKFGDLVVISVKPGDVGTVLDQIRGGVSGRKILVSVAAGITIAHISKHLRRKVPVVRVMPNIACFVNEGMMAVCPAEGTSKQDLKAVTDLLSLVGRVTVLEEKYFDAVTGLVGSGPAYIYLIIEALADVGVKLGLSREASTRLAAQTILGASKMVLETGEHPAKLREMVVTPGGTTIEGLFELERGNLRAVLASAIIRAAERARELSS